MAFVYELRHYVYSLSVAVKCVSNCFVCFSGTDCLE